MSFRKTTLRSLTAASAFLILATPALAGEANRARAAIGQAQGKIDAASKLNVSPELMAKAQAALRLSQEQLKSGDKEESIASAIKAQEYADTAVGESQRHADASAQMQTDATLSAQQQADAANARANAAEQAAASAAADAQAARASAAMAAATPPASTTVTTETVKSAPVTTATRKVAAKRKVVRRTSAPRTAVAESTTTTVTTHN